MDPNGIFRKLGQLKYLVRPMEDRFSTIRHYEIQTKNIVIRHYFKQRHFDDLIRTGELHFSPASMVNDQFEGFYAKRSFSVLESRLREIGLKHDWDDTELAVCTAREAWDVNAINAQKTVVISCWTLGENEDKRMWDEYGEKSPNAVALETKVGFLSKALGRDFLFVPIIYDHDLEISSKELSLETFFYKRPKYDWEKELRIVAEMEKGERIGTARRVPLVLKKLPCRFIVALGATHERRIEVERQVRECGNRGEVAFSSLY